jgi:hypothetical protein
MARKKITEVRKERIALYGRIFTSQEDFFTINLGFNAWKGVKTRIENSANIRLSEPMTPHQVYVVLNHIINSSSKAKVKAFELIQLFQDKPEELEQIMKKEEKIEIDIPLNLIDKYQVDINDVVVKYNIIIKEKGTIKENINKRLKVYRFEYDIAICKLLNEMLEGGLI